jgi:putative ABC transport system permease protein
MLLNYFKIALRNLAKRRFYTGINILGLSVGLTAAAIVILYAQHELSYDQYHKNADRIYRVSGKKQDNWFAALSKSYSDALYKGNFPELKAIARVRHYPPKFIRFNDKKLFEEKLLITDPGSDFFNLFNVRFVEGSAREALKQPYAAVLTASLAQQLFGNENAIGKTIVLDTMNLTVTAVIKDLPGNTHFDYKILITDAKAMEEASGMFTYCVLPPSTDLQALKKKIIALPKPENTFDVIADVAILPLTRLHFEGNMTYEMKPPGNKQYLLLFALTGIMIVILSCTNYMNLSIAIYAERRKEIAVRKVSGARNLGLAIQFLCEAVCLALLCLPFTLLLIELVLPLFNRFMDVQLSNDFIHSFKGWGSFAGLTLLIGIISGSYPAWVLPKIKAISLFRKTSLGSKGGLTMRQVLVTFQVTILVTMLSAGWIIHNQLSYLNQKDLGFNKEGVLKLSRAWALDSAQYFTLKNELLRHSGVVNVSQGFAPGDEDYGFSYKAPGAETVHNDIISFGTDYEYLSTLGIQLADAGFSDITKEKPRRLVLVNQTTEKSLGYANAVGQKIILHPGTKYERTYTIHGVIKDFHYFSLHRPVAPMILRIQNFGSSVSQNILVKVHTKDLEKTITKIRTTIATIVPDIPLTLHFLDESLEKLYEKEQRLSSLSKVLLMITLFLAVMGLVGLAAYMMELRTKEIGIRKVLGASFMNVLQLLALPFVRIMLIATISGCCISLLLMSQWLQNFTYKTTISWTVFAGSTLLLLGIIAASVCGHAFRAARKNPVKALRSE